MNRFTNIAAAVALVGGMTAACGRDTQDDRWGVAQNDDALMTAAIQARYFGDDRIKREDVDVEVDGGAATLSGTVASEELRARAGSIAESVQGVTSVRNEIAVDTTIAAAEPDEALGESRISADWITMKIQAQYFADVDVKGREIDVTTSDDGEVTLRGNVDSEAAREAAQRIARATEGVTSVRSELVVEGAATAPRAETTVADSQAPDAWTTTKIEAKYFLDPDVKGRDIDVTSENGVVTLTGVVASPEERQRAVELAENTDGVAEVRDQLRVEIEQAPEAQTDTRPGSMTGPVMATDRTREGTPDAPDDEWIAMKIQAEYFMDDELRSSDIAVDSTQGTVTLEGSVPSAEQRDAAEEIARETPGVSRVVSRIETGGEALTPPAR